MDLIGKINGFVTLLGCLLIGVMAGRAVEETPSTALRFTQPGSKAIPDFQKHVIFVFYYFSQQITDQC